MSEGSWWRSIQTADQYRQHDYADFAQEFLQRNHDYRRDHAATLDRIVEHPEVTQSEEEGLAGRWGLSFPTHPSSDPRASPALWSPLAAPDVVVIGTVDIAAIPLLRGFEPLVDAFGDHEHHIVAASGTARLRLCLRESKAHCLDCLIILRDPCAVARLAAAAQFERVMRGLRLEPDRAASPSAYRRNRLVQLLRIHDALDAGATTRDLAFGIVFPHHRTLSGATWSGSSERRHTLRLIADARQFVKGGYRKLLRHS